MGEVPQDEDEIAKILTSISRLPDDSIPAIEDSPARESRGRQRKAKSYEGGSLSPAIVVSSQTEKRGRPLELCISVYILHFLF
ncbi:hypothetical protein KIPB_014060 [Kipferlia bialata]|uniref:Uncharacterized protein n=1 Tax=Kipferlia bialata TaxID=797122 RepID=A0A9K3D8T0_9EUKA|nr:hypothetical protein KIPB_014060 [Kipferlia bialata]|eukprot:g14060.t1